MLVSSLNTSQCCHDETGRLFGTIRARQQDPWRRVLELNAVSNEQLRRDERTSSFGATNCIRTHFVVTVRLRLKILALRCGEIAPKSTAGRLPPAHLRVSRAWATATPLLMGMRVGLCSTLPMLIPPISQYLRFRRTLPETIRSKWNG